MKERADNSTGRDQLGGHAGGMRVWLGVLALIVLGVAGLVVLVLWYLGR